MKRKTLLFALLLLKILLAFIVFRYFMGVQSSSQLTKIPFLLLFSCIGYIITQLLSYYISKEQNWWDWVYYLALLSIMITVSFATENTYPFFNWFVKVGSFLLFVPIAIDLFYLSKQLKK
ncbi:MAG: hypothetical protein V4638_04025 [Bacteroidota bacterium]